MPGLRFYSQSPAARSLDGKIINPVTVFPDFLRGGMVARPVEPLAHLPRGIYITNSRREQIVAETASFGRGAAVLVRAPRSCRQTRVHEEQRRNTVRNMSRR